MDKQTDSACDWNWQCPACHRRLRTFDAAEWCYRSHEGTTLAEKAQAARGALAALVDPNRGPSGTALAQQEARAALARARGEVARG